MTSDERREVAALLLPLMAKDRTRHARRRKQERKSVSLVELVRWAIDNLRYEFADAAKCAVELRRVSDGI